MAMKLHETHPALVHYPLSFFPLSLAADALGEALDRPVLRELGRITMPLAAGSTMMAAATGLIAQQEVDGSEEAFDLLITHRNLNLLAGGVIAAMAAWRWGRERAPAGYLAAGLAGFGAVVYSAYLGGQMVYDHGMGVEKAGGLQDGVPELTPREAGRAAARAGRDLAEGARLSAAEVAEEVAAGKVAPALEGDGEGEGG